MNIEIESITWDQLDEYAKIPISFEVTSILDVSFLSNGINGISIKEREIASSYLKDYDDSETPDDWAKQWDIKNWGFFVATNSKSGVIAGITIALKTQGLNMLEGRNDLAVIWDIRVKPEYRNKGIGTLLFQQAIDFSQREKCKTLKIETQNININACRFYAKQNCYLGGIHANAYEEFPSDIQFLFYKNI
ncbi:MAG: GNAT family N-acetyltransferase [Bacteroidota bacterium]